MTELDYKRKASEFLAKGRYEDAIAQYRELIESSRKKNPAILNLIGDIHVKQGTFEAAFESYVEASRLYAEEGLFHNGIAVGKKILRLDREQTEVYGILGNLYARQGLGIDCIKFLDEYARRKETLDEYPAALAAFAEACEILADCAEIHIAYGAMLERVGRREDAVASYRAASRIYGDKGQTQAAEHWGNRAATDSGVDDDDDETDSEEVGDVSEMMNLKTLRDDAPPRSPAPAATPAPPTATDDDGTPWRSFDPAANPGLPAPPPLPSRSPSAGEPVSAPPPPPAAKPAETRPAPAAAEEGLELQLTGPLPTSPDSAPVDEDSETLDLSDLPGIILPDHGGAEAPTEAATEPPAAARPEPPAEAPVAAATSPSMEGASPVAPEVPAELPIAQAPTAPPVESGPPSPADAELAAFFETSEVADPNEQAVVIGDDFELLREGGDVSEVIADFRAATGEILDLDDHQAHYDLGTTYMEMELFDESAAEFEIAACGEQFALPSREMLGYCFLRKGQIELAIRELRKGLEIPGHEEHEKLGLLYNLGIACGVLDSEHEAIESFQRILEVDPNFRDTRMRLERLVQASG